MPRNILLVNLIHDEWQVETSNNMKEALDTAQIMSDSLVSVSKELNLNCPMAGSFYNEDCKDYTIGVNWQQTH